jgi:hypothetical protein
MYRERRFPVSFLQNISKDRLAQLVPRTRETETVSRAIQEHSNPAPDEGRQLSPAAGRPLTVDSPAAVLDSPPTARSVAAPLRPYYAKPGEAEWGA